MPEYASKRCSSSPHTPVRAARQPRAAQKSCEVCFHGVYPVDLFHGRQRVLQARSNGRAQGPQGEVDVGVRRRKRGGSHSGRARRRTRHGRGLTRGNASRFGSNHPGVAGRDWREALDGRSEPPSPVPDDGHQCRSAGRLCAAGWIQRATSPSGCGCPAARRSWRARSPSPAFVRLPCAPSVSSRASSSCGFQSDPFDAPVAALGLSSIEQRLDHGDGDRDAQN